MCSLSSFPGKAYWWRCRAYHIDLCMEFCPLRLGGSNHIKGDFELWRWWGGEKRWWRRKWLKFMDFNPYKVKLWINITVPEPILIAAQWLRGSADLVYYGSVTAGVPESQLALGGCCAPSTVGRGATRQLATWLCKSWPRVLEQECNGPTSNFLYKYSADLVCKKGKQLRARRGLQIYYFGIFFGHSL